MAEQTTSEFEAGVTPVEDFGRVTWTASEYIAHQKNARWYINLGVAAVIIAAIVYVFTRDPTTTAVIIIAAIALGGYAARPPRELEYRLDEHGLTIDKKFFPYTNFKSFTVDEDVAFASIILMPLRRFAPSISIYFAPQDEEEIADLLSAVLPYEPHHQDPIDKLMRRIRF
ncbi:MAG: hypothetical protein JWN38_678 [Candidatus Saccharibacteria bacterium]|nr:hypothetical protein [Candidatus Saccharibacteria bacterium]